MGPGENAGAVDVGDGLAVAFKVESHNHPSAVEPFQGAATGVGGILRDIFAIGARPIAVLDSLRFGEPSSPRSRYLLDRAVAGIAHYGNSVGVRDRRRRGLLRGPLRAELPGQRDGPRARRPGPHDPQRRRRRRERRRALRLLDRPGRHRRRVGPGQRGARHRRGQAPDRAGRRPVRGQEGAGVLARAARARPARLAAGPRRRGPDVVVGGDGVQGRGRPRPRRRPRCRCARRTWSRSRSWSASRRSACSASASPTASTRCSRSARSGRSTAPRSAWSRHGGRLRVLDGDAWWATCRSSRSSTTARSTTSSRPRRPGRCTRRREATLDAGADARATLLALLASPNIASRLPLFQQYDWIVQSRTVRRPGEADAAVLRLPGGNAIAVADRRLRPQGRRRPVHGHDRERRSSARRTSPASAPSRSG